MKLLLPSTVLLLMVSVGMSLNWTQFLANWRRLTLVTWAKLLAVTFIIPPIIALALASLLRLDRGALIGLFLIAVAPGAPLMTRVVAKRGFDMELAASYQPSTLGGLSHSYHDSAPSRHGGLALRAQYLGVTA